MIAFLRGKLAFRDARSVVIDVGGVGYLAQVSAQTLAALGPAGAEVSLLVHTQVREDAITLFGFHDADERDCFMLLVGVQGVGTRIALSLLSVLDPHGVRTAILGDDRRSLGLADGVGPKLATRIAAELRPKVVALMPGAGRAAALPPGAPSARGDTLTALMNLGMQQREADRLIAAVLAQPNPPADTGAMVRACLALSSGQAAA